jgi:hypothetical protein
MSRNKCFFPDSNITCFISICDLLFCRLERTLQHVVQLEMDAVDLTGGYTAATLWQRFAVMDRKEYFHYIITIDNIGPGTNTV